MNGAMTYILTKALRQSLDISYGDLLDKMSDEINQVNAKRCLHSGIFKRMFRHKIIQVLLLIFIYDAHAMHIFNYVIITNFANCYCW